MRRKGIDRVPIKLEEQWEISIYKHPDNITRVGFKFDGPFIPRKGEKVTVTITEVITEESV